MRYYDTLPQLRAAYNTRASKREGSDISTWKVRERDMFLEMLSEGGSQTLLELGSGPGRDGAFFRDNGHQVTCTDLSPAMVALCRAKGLEAHVMDF